MTFLEIQIQNFFSFGPELQTLDLSSPGMYLITGQNQITQSSNGSGKSSLFDAICYALFGQVTKNVNVPQVVNEQIGQDCMVCLKFEVNGEIFIVERWKKQKKHYDKLLLYKDVVSEETLISQANKGETQLQINDIVKFNYKSFINAVMMTQEQVSGFLQADVTKKKEVIENILQLNILTKYHWIAQQKRKILKKSYEKIKTKEESSDTLIDNTKQSMQEYANSCNVKKEKNIKMIERLGLKLKKINETDIDAERANIKEANRLAKEQEDLIVEYQHAADKLKSLRGEKDTVESTKFEYTELLKNANRTKKRLDKELKSENSEKEIVVNNLEHANENPNECPICENKIEEDKHNMWLTSQEELLEKINSNISSKTTQLEENEVNVTNWQVKSDDLDSQITAYNKVIDKQDKKAKALKTEYKAIDIPDTMDEEELNTLDDNKKEVEQQIRDKEGTEFIDKKYLKSLMEQAKQYAVEKKEYTKELAILRDKFTITKWWEDSLSSKKNSMKSWCINNVIGYFNSKIKYYIDRFFEGAVSLQLDNNLNEVITVNNNERVYDMFSGGEKRRLNLAILFALNDLVKANVSSKMNIMFLDEVLSNFLDDKGISSVLEVLQDMSDVGDNSIFVIDHKDNFKDYPSFVNVTVVKGKDGYSRIKLGDK